jgi:predicted GNAT family N-acyltransferase
MLKIINIDMQHPLYQEERELRNKILLRPIGIPDYGWEKNDPISWHFAAVSDGKIVGCVLLVPLDEQCKKGQLIQMAVAKNWQGKGLGKQLVSALIDFAKNKDFTAIEIHSRADVTSFYVALGFSVYGKVFEEVGVQHQHLIMDI